ncbi:MAG: hypothetical protein IPM50_11295 [Acidobacteriota bacterium]|nr:MAG: hypothetical protein IPM50_11295 [Acidobacteriota bacterium]
MRSMGTVWEECLRPNRFWGRQQELCISLNRRGEIALGGKTWLALGRPGYAVLRFDREGRRIGLKFVAGGTPNAFPIRPLGEGDAKVIRARRLLKQFGIEVPTTLRFDPKEEKDGSWILDLKTASVPKKVTHHYRNRRRATPRGEI